MSLSDALKEKRLDVRLRDKLLTEGNLNKEEVKKYLKKLEDEGSNFTFTDDAEAADQDTELSEQYPDLLLNDKLRVENF